MSAAPPIPIIVCARNEERAIAKTIEALLVAKRHAEQRCAHTYVLRVVDDESSDRTAALARAYEGVEVRPSRGGKVEAQRTGLERAHASAALPFAIFCDADVRPSEDALLALTTLLDERDDVQVATCPLRPLAPRRRTLLADALHTYNLRRGFSSSRTWFNGKLFAIRVWHVPSRAALEPRIAGLEPDPFYDFDAGITIDDIYLSRAVVLEHGPRAIAESDVGYVLYRAPETWRGMNRYYRRMRRELERMDRLFPETARVHREHGHRTADLLASSSRRERMHHALFSAALAVCKGAYVAERAWTRHVSRRPRAPWPAIEETKAW